MLTWPHAHSDWSHRLDAVYPVFAGIGAQISRYEPVLSVCQSRPHAESIRNMLHRAGAEPGRLLFAIAASNDTWARDHGPLTTLSGSLPRLNDFVFNGWGGKFEAGDDSAITGSLHEQGAFAATALLGSQLVLEGGAIETDGAGSLLATRSSMITDTRNPGLDQAGLEKRLSEYLGIERFLWLDHGDISGDDTDGHIDTLARFCDQQTLVYATAPVGDSDHPALSEMHRELLELTMTDGRPYRLVPLPFPGVHRDRDGRRLPATYANFLIINGAVLLPVYGVAQDQEAAAVIQSVFPDRNVIPIDCREIIRQNGSLHCLTMQFPAQVTVRDTLEQFAA